MTALNFVESHKRVKIKSRYTEVSPHILRINVLEIASFVGKQFTKSLNLDPDLHRNVFLDLDPLKTNADRQH